AADRTRLLRAVRPNALVLLHPRVSALQLRCVHAPSADPGAAVLCRAHGMDLYSDRRAHVLYASVPARTRTSARRDHFCSDASVAGPLVRAWTLADRRPQ